MLTTGYFEGTTDSVDSALLAGFASFMATYMFVIIAIAVVQLVAMWKVFTKAGKPGWASIIPIYNAVVFFQIVGLNPWWILINLIPGIGQIIFAVLTIVAQFRLAKSFDKDVAWGFGLWLLAPIFYCILGFGKSEYVGPNGEKEAV